MASDEGSENQTLGWDELNVGPLALVDDTVLFRLWRARFNSGSTDAERFIHDPLGAMIEGGVREVTREFTVTTICVNHERMLLKHPMIVLALVSLETATVVLTIYKAPV